MKKLVTKFHSTPDVPKTPGEAAAMLLEGQRLAEVAKGTRGPDAVSLKKRSELFISKGEDALQVKESQRVTGGELIILPKLPLDGDNGCLVMPIALSEEQDEAMSTEFLLDTTQNPNMVAINASRERMNLADQSQCLEMALDASDSVKGANSLEKMLCHQLAAAHRMAMKTLSQADEVSFPTTFLEDEKQLDAMNKYMDVKSKLINAGARMMSIFQNGMQTLAKVRNGGKQEVIVQHVHVNGDAQAVVAGKMDYPTGGRGQGGSQHGK